MNSNARFALALLTNNQNTLRLVRYVCERRSWKCRTASVPEQLRRALSNDVAVIVVDLQSNSVYGLSLLRYLAEERHPANVILIGEADTLTLSSASRLAEMLGLGVLGFLRQPVTPSALEALIGRRPLRWPVRMEDTNQATGSGDLWDALRAGALMPHYQPIVALADRRVVGWEALLRWAPKSGTARSAGDLLGESNDVLLLREVFQLVSRTSIRDMSRSLAHRDDTVAISINIDPATLQDPLLPDRLAFLAARWGVATNRVTLELVERSLVPDNVRSLECMLQLRLLGFGIAIDDFGTGFSSPSYLLRVPATAIKIDRCFVQHIEHSNARRSLVAHFVKLANDLELTVTAEGIESQAQLDFLRAIGCHCGQGFLISRPLDLRDARLWWQMTELVNEQAASTEEC